MRDPHVITTHGRYTAAVDNKTTGPGTKIDDSSENSYSNNNFMLKDRSLQGVRLVPLRNLLSLLILYSEVVLH